MNNPHPKTDLSTLCNSKVPNTHTTTMNFSAFYDLCPLNPEYISVKYQHTLDKAIIDTTSAIESHFAALLKKNGPKRMLEWLDSEPSEILSDHLNQLVEAMLVPLRNDETRQYFCNEICDELVDIYEEHLTAKVNVQDRYQKTALIRNVTNDQTEIVQALMVVPGINVNAQDKLDDGESDSDDDSSEEGWEKLDEPEPQLSSC